MLIFVLFFFVSSYSFAGEVKYKSHEVIVKEFSQVPPGAYKKMKKRRLGTKLDSLIPKERQKNIDLEKKKPKTTASLFSLFINEAEAACTSPRVITTPTPDPIPTPPAPIPTPQPSPTPSPTPSTVNTPTPKPVVSPTPVPIVSPSPTPVLTPIPTPPILVDLRRYDSYVRNQGAVSSCTAHATLGGVESLLNHTTPHVTLSVPYLWSQYQQLNSLAAMTAAAQHNQIPESYWPEGAPKPTIAVASLASKGAFRLTGYQELMGDPIAKVRSEIDDGKPVYIALTVPMDMSRCLSSISYNTSLIPSEGHALLIVGYSLDSRVQGGGYWILKNSWGTSCGDHGYQYMPMGICDRDGVYCDFWTFKGVSR